MALVSGFDEDNFHTVFFLNALITTLITIMTIQITFKLSHVKDKDGNKTDSSPETPLHHLFPVAISVFVMSLLAYWLMNIVFGYGKGLMAK